MIIYRQGLTQGGIQVIQRSETSPVICICGATPVETCWIRKRMRTEGHWSIGSVKYSKGTYLNRAVLLVQSGVGGSNIRRALRNLPDDYIIGVAINIGCAGGLIPGIKVAHINIPYEIRLHPQGATESVPEGMFVHVRSAAGAFRIAKVHFRPSATVTRAFDREQKRELRMRAPDIGCVDLESYHFARFFAQRGIPYLVVRGVSDTYNDMLPPAPYLDPSCWKRLHRIGFPAGKLLCIVRFHIAVLMACWMNRRFVDLLLRMMPLHGV